MVSAKMRITSKKHTSIMFCSCQFYFWVTNISTFASDFANKEVLWAVVPIGDGQEDWI